MSYKSLATSKISKSSSSYKAISANHPAVIKLKKFKKIKVKPLF